ncbi:MAG: hypothetical protein K0S61_3526 [Anaerocolumna sp.]|jgi:hypothetical protein|nr:hypothetical protein [Anaerocolumna sp.]
MHLNYHTREIIIKNQNKSIKSHQLIKGSLTVEATLVLPIFLFGILAVIYLLQIIGIQESLQQAITQMGLDTSKYAYVYQYIMDYGQDTDDQSVESEHSKEEDNSAFNTPDNIEETKKASVEALVSAGIDSTYFKAMLPKYVEEDRINNSCIKGGMSGVHTFMSSFMSEGDDIDIILSYSVKIPVPILSIKEIPFLLRVRIRGFTGHTTEINGSDNEEEQENNKTYVYITDTGVVYHLTKECSHLKLSIEEADYKYIEDLRNDSGGKYYSCSICIHKNDIIKDQNVYITKSGDRYHSSLNCSGLKRTILTITLDQVGDKTLCTRCRKMDSENKN